MSCTYLLLWKRQSHRLILLAQPESQDSLLALV